jgi:hypothetical protein
VIKTLQDRAAIRTMLRLYAYREFIYFRCSDAIILRQGQIALSKVLIGKANIPDNTVMRASAPMAPANTVILGWRMAMMAAMKKVLSPNSDTMMTEREATNAWMKPTSPKGGASVVLSLPKKFPCCK